MTSENRSPREHDPLLAPIRPRPTASSTAKDQTTKTVLYCLVTVAFISMSYAFIEAPMYRLYESVICERYYKKHGPSVIGPAGRIPEQRCKIDSIQQELAVLLTQQAQANLCASLLASVYTRGISRKTLLKLNIGCHLCTQVFIYSFLSFGDFPVELTLLSSAFTLVACGPEMRQETIFMVMADATKKDERLTVFILGQVIVVPLAVVAKRIAAIIMAQSIRIPIALGMISILISWSLIWFIPFGVQQVSEQETRDNEQIEGSLTLLRTIMRQNKKSFEVLFLSRSIFFLTCTFLVTSTFGQLMAGTVFLQYIERKLGFDMADASRVQANSDLMNMISLIITFLICGKLNSALLGNFGLWLESKLLQHFNRNQLLAIKELSISQFCALMMTLGFIVIGTAQNYGLIITGLLICASGQAFRMSTRATLTAMVKESHPSNTTGLYTIIFYFDLIGGTLINSMLAFSFAKGLEWKGTWICLPFFCTAFVWSIVWVITVSIKTVGQVVVTES